MRSAFHLSVFWLLLGLSSGAMAFDLSLDLNKLKSAFSNAKNSATTVDEQGEIAIGDGVAASLLGAAPLVQDESLLRYVNELGRWLAMQTDRPDLPWHFGVLDTDSVNAFAAPGGYVFVTRGLVLRMQSEAELAGVLAHEIAHVLQRHHLQAIQKNARAGLLSDIAGIASDNSSQSALAKTATDKAVSVGTELYARGLDKGDELEADRMGVVIAARAGYDPYGLPVVLQMLDGMNPQDGALAMMFKTHPAPRQRLQLLDALMVDGNMQRYAAQPVGVDRFQAVVGGYARSGK